MVNTLSNYIPVKPIAVSGSNGSFTNATISFGNSNGLSFYTTNGSIVGSGYATTDISAVPANVLVFGNTTGQSSSGTHALASLNISAVGILSAGWSNNTLILSAPGTTGLTQLSAGMSTFGNTAGNTGIASAQLVLVGGNNITLSGATGAGGYQTISIVGGAGGGGSGGVGISAAGGNITSGTASFANANGISFSINGQTISGSVPATSIISGTGGVSVSTSGSTIFIGASTGIGAGSINFSAGTTSNNVGSVVFSNNNGVSFGLNGSTITASYNSTQFAGTGATFAGFNVSGAVTLNSNGINMSLSAGAGGGGVNFGVSTAGNTAGATGTVSTGNVVLVGSGPISLSQATGAAGSAATITINGPALSSIVGSGLVTVSTAGSTININAAVPLFSRMDFGVGGSNVLALTQGSASFKYIQLLQPLTFSRVDVPVLVSLATAATANTAALNISSGLVIYSRTGSTLSPIMGTIGNTTYTWASNSSNYSNISGGKNISFGINGSLSAGEYWVAFQLSTTNNSSIGTATTQLGNTISLLGAGISYSASQIGDFGNTYSQSRNLVSQGLYSNTVTATNQTIALSNLSATGAAGENVQYQLVLRNY